MNTDPISSTASSPSLGRQPRASPSGLAPTPNALPSTDPHAGSAPLSPAALDLQDAAVRRAVADSNEKLKLANIDLRFQFNLDRHGGVRSVQLLDSATQQVVIQYPSETMLAVRDQIDQMIMQNEKGSLNAGRLFSMLA